MIADRLFLSPLWVQGLLRGTYFAIFIGAIVALLYPTFADRIGLPLAALAVIALCAIATGATLSIQRPVRRRALQALEGLDRPRSLAALKALRTGEVPADAEVLAAAVRTGILAQAYRRKAGRGQRAAQWAIPAVLITVGVVELFRLPPVFGGLAIVIGILLLVQGGARLRWRRRTDANLRVLRDADPQTGAEEAAGLPPIRYWRVVAVVAVVAVAVTAFMTLVVVVTHVSPDCRIAGAAVNLIYDKRQLNNPRNSEATLTAYREWSKQLRSYADQVSDPHVAPHLRTIGDLAADAESQVEQARGSRDAPPPGGDTTEQDKAFDATIQALYKEDNAVADLCFPHH
jgi:hypothetical protein